MYCATKNNSSGLYICLKIASKQDRFTSFGCEICCFSIVFLGKPFLLEGGRVLCILTSFWVLLAPKRSFCSNIDSKSSNNIDGLSQENLINGAQTLMAPLTTIIILI